MVLPRAPVVDLGLVGGWQRRLHGNPPEVEGERPQDASNGGGEEEVPLVEYQADISGVYERRPDKVFISLIRVFWPDMALISTISLVKKTRIRLINTLSGRRS